MKRFFYLVPLFVLVWAGGVHAAVLTFGDADLLSFLETYDDPSGNATLNSVTDVIPGAEYDIDLTGSSFSQIQIGYDFTGGTLPSQYYDISAYDTYEMTFTNNSSADWVMVNLFVNTGWTDSGWDQPNLYTENTWTWLAPGQSTVLLLDLTTLGTIGSGSQGVGDDRREWVSGIGFNVGTNIGDGDYFGGDDIQVQVAPVPIPAAVWLLGSGLVGLIGIRRRWQA